MNISRLTLSFLALFICQQSVAQKDNGAPAIVSPVSASPNAASLGVYGEVPVGLYTGIPNINIPFYEINSGGIKVPIGISYHAGGVKVEETASWVGLGWSLNAGGVITRQVRGGSDEAPNGYFYNWKRTQDYVNNNLSDIQKQEYLFDSLDGSLDTQQDIYYYNIGGESGKFFLDPSGKGICIPQSKTLIEFGTFLGVESCWKITSTNGQVSYFTDKELSRSQSGTGIGISDYSISSWYLTKILNVHGTESIDFTYEDTNIKFKTISSQTKYILIEGQPTFLRDNFTSYAVNYVDGKRLTKISFKNGQVDLIKDPEARQDFTYDYKLQSMIIKSTDLSFYKRVDFNSSYVSSDDIATIGYPEERIRLFLNGISVRSLNNIVADTYQFNYNNPQLLPSRNSFNQDHWGYFNNAENGANFIPTTTLNFPSQQFTVQSADRTVNPAYCQAGMLQSIVYPLGGRTEFKYENHTADNVPPALDVAAEYLDARILADGSTTYYQTSFSVTEAFGPQKGGVRAEFSIYRQGCPNITTAGCPVTLLHFPDGHVVNINESSSLFLPIGNYTIEANLTGVPANMLNEYYLRVRWAKGVSGTQQYNVPVGGLRIKETRNYDQNNLITSSKFYTYLIPDSAGHSSGSLLSFPNYVGEFTDMTAKKFPNSDAIAYYTAHYISISSGSNMPLVSTQNSSVGYKNVQVKSDELGVIGKTETEFTFATDIYYDEFPFPPSISREWLRGFEKGNKTYRYNAVSEKYELIHQKTNEYNQLKGESYTGIKVGKNIFRSADYMPEPNDIKIGESIVTTGWYPLTRETIIDLDPKINLSTQTINEYEYNEDYLKVKKISTTNSKGLVKTSSSIYPFDMVAARDPDGVYSGMLGKNIIDPVVEQRETTNGKTKLQLTNYMKAYPGIFVPASVETLNPFTGLNETRIRYRAYAPDGHLLSVAKEKGTISSYQWGYQSQYPIAELSNASPSEFYNQNFEENADFDGNVSRVTSKPHTGRYSGLITNAAATELVAHSNQYLNIIPGKARVFSYSGWVYSDGPSVQLVLFMYRAGETNYFSYIDDVQSNQTGKWVYIQKNFLVPADVSRMRMRIDNNSAGNVWFDDLRILPADANMSSYTYDPMVGMTSSMDNKGQSTTYEYDIFQRLIRVWDQNGYLLKSNDYHYKN